MAAIGGEKEIEVVPKAKTRAKRLNKRFLRIFNSMEKFIIAKKLGNYTNSGFIIILTVGG